MESAMKDAEQRWVEKAEKDIEEYGKKEKNPVGAYLKASNYIQKLKLLQKMLQNY